MDAIDAHQWWAAELVKCLKGEFENRIDYFFIGEIGGEIVGLVWYCTPKDTKDLATFGRVFTKPEHRGKGIASILTEIATENFKEENGLAMYLASGNPAAIRIYEKFGFRRLKGCIFRWVASMKPEEFEDKYYSYSSPVTIRKPTWADLPRFESLFNLPLKWPIIYYPYGIVNTGYEGQFIPFMAGIEIGKVKSLVLQNNLKRVVGMASLTPLSSGAESHVRTLDFVVHPNYLCEAEKLLKEMENIAQQEKIKIIRCYVAENNLEKIRILEKSKFNLVAKYEKGLIIKGREISLFAYEKFIYPQD